MIIKLLLVGTLFGFTSIVNATESNIIVLMSDIKIQVTPQPNNRTRGVTTQYSLAPNSILKTNEIYDCVEQRHKLTSTQLYENGKLEKDERRKIPYWDINNKYENEVQHIVCAK